MQHTNIAIAPNVAGRQVTAASRRARMLRAVGRGAIYFALILMSCVYFLPFWWMLVTSLKTLPEVFSFPPTFFPRTFTFAGYVTAWNYLPWPRYFLNTMTIVVGVLFGVVLTSSLCAYGFSRFRFPGRDIVFVIMLASMMLPAEVTIIPAYIFFRNLGWLDSVKPLIIPAWFGGGAFNIFLIRQFFTSIPIDLTDAARIDGCSRLRIWWQIMLPLSKPVLTVITVFTIQSAWNDFFLQRIYLLSKDKLTVSLGLQVFMAQASFTGGTAQYQDIGLYTALMAAATVVTLPMVVLFLSAQRYFVEGIQMTGIKG